MKRQSSLFDAWKQPSPKVAKTAVHERLSQRIGSEAFLEFQAQNEKQREEELAVLAKRALRRAGRERSGGLQDPSLRGHGVSSNRMGRPKGRAVYEKLGITNRRRVAEQCFVETGQHTRN